MQWGGVRTRGCDGAVGTWGCDEVKWGLRD